MTDYTQPHCITCGEPIAMTPADPEDGAAVASGFRATADGDALEAVGMRGPFHRRCLPPDVG